MKSWLLTIGVILFFPFGLVVGIEFMRYFTGFVGWVVSSCARD